MGNTNNPNGAPDKMNTFSWICRKLGSRKSLDEIKEDELTLKEKGVLQMIKKAVIDGDLSALIAWMDREEGKAKQVNENRDMTLEDNPMYQQLKSMTSQFKEKTNEKD
jgi:hypothetical protein